MDGFSKGMKGNVHRAEQSKVDGTEDEQFVQWRRTKADDMKIGSWRSTTYEALIQNVGHQTTKIQGPHTPPRK